jgi:hypothetical protein
MKRILSEGLDYMDLEGLISTRVSVDEYEAHMGKNSDIVTLAFTVKGEHAGKDLSGWFEKGYDWVLDAKLSEGEVSPGKYLVFVELNRRRSVPERIIELLDDLATLTGLKPTEYTIVVGDEDYEPEEDVLAKVIVTSPHDYRVDKEKEGELNEMRELAQLDNIDVYRSDDDDIKNYKMIAGI